jgi:photosystem II stability/assembly factor-like uncharacterized protein
MHAGRKAVATLGAFALAVVGIATLIRISPGAAATEPWFIQATNPLGYFTGVSCPSTLNCVAVGVASDNAILETTSDGGANWTSQTIPSDVTKLASVSCPTTSDCIAVGSSLPPPGNSNDAGAIITTSDGGVTWESESLPSVGVGTLDSISCGSASDCVAVGSCTADGDCQTILSTTNGGANWILDPSDGDPFILYSVSCPSATICYAVSMDYFVKTTNGGATWETGSVPGGEPIGQVGPNLNVLNSISCPTVLNCTAVGLESTSGGETDSIIMTSNGGITWTTQTASNDGTGLTAVSCFNTSNCTAVANGMSSAQNSNVISTTDGGSSWANQPLPFDVALLAVDCLSPSQCEAAGSDPSIQEGAIIGETPPSIPPPAPGPHGYWLVGSDGGIFSFGKAYFYGSTGSLKLQRPVVGITATPDHGGYWLVAADGGVFSFGDTKFYGSIPGLGLAPAGSNAPKRLNAPIVGMVPSTDGRGYFMVASDGGVFAFGDAKFEGSCPGIGGCSGAAVAVMPDTSGSGYWLVTTTGHVYSFGDAHYYGAPGPQFVPVTAAVATPDGKGYWILFSNGVVAGYGDAGSFGSPAGATGGGNPATAILATTDGGGYWVTTANGTVYNYGDAPNDGGMSGTHLNGAIIAATGF